MNHQQYYTLLYDLALATSGETSVKPLLTKALQRVMYHTGFPCGIFVRPLTPNNSNSGEYIDSLVEIKICHDAGLPNQGATAPFDAMLFNQTIELIELSNNFNYKTPFRYMLKIPVPKDGTFLLFAIEKPAITVPYRQLFAPIMNNFSKNLFLVRENELNTARLKDEINQHLNTLAALETSEKLLTQAQRIGRIGNWTLNLDTGELLWSDEIYRIFGKTKNEFSPTHDKFDTLVHKDDIDNVRKAMEASKTSGEYDIEHRIVVKYGEIRTVHERAVLTKHPETGNLFMHGTVQDVTERKKAELEKLTLSKQLQQSQKVQAIGHLAGGVAHEFNNILAVILGYGALLKSAIVEDSPQSKLAKYIDPIIESSERAKALVSNMLAYSRSNTESTEIVNPAKEIKDVIGVFRNALPKNISIVERFDTETTLVTFDSTQLNQVVTHLISNARDAIKDHGTITIGIKKSIISNSCQTCGQPFDGEFLIISISDTGTGIDSETLKKIFNPFFSTKGVGKGTGMGLSIVHGIIHAAKGHILVETSVGKGSTFSILLPITSHETSAL